VASSNENIGLKYNERAFSVDNLHRGVSKSDIMGHGNIVAEGKVTYKSMVKDDQTRKSNEVSPRRHLVTSKYYVASRISEEKS
jgi:hypothetical protein